MQSNDYGYAGKGVYTTPEPIGGRTYGDITMPLKARIKNPYIRTGDNFQESLDPYVWIPANKGKYSSMKDTSKAWTKMMKGKGYDAFIDKATNNGEIVVFDPKNIKSRFASFDPKQANTGKLIDDLADEAGLINTKELDYIKRGLDDIIGAGKRKGKGGGAAAVNNTKKELLRVVDKANGIYPEARKVYETGKKLTEALEDGRKFLRKDADSALAHMQTLTPNEAKMFQQGYAKSLRDFAAKAKDGANLYNKVAGSPYQREQLKAIIGEEHFDNFIKTVKAEDAYAKTRGNLVNSMTQPRQQKNAEAFNDGVAATGELLTGNKLGAVKRLFKSISPGGASNEQKAGEVVRILFAQGNDQAKVIKRLIELEKVATAEQEKVLGVAIGMASSAVIAKSINEQ